MNLSEKLKSSLNIDFLKIINLVGKSADEYGTNAYIIGGVVRDLLLNKEIYDIDIVIEGNAIEFCRFLENKEICKIIRTTEEFGTAKVNFNFANDFIIDFASTRTENYPHAGHLPIIDKIGCSLKEDILRRDFSVNALAIKVNLSEFGKLIDYTQGLNALEKKELEILHDNSFIDDPTRIIRGLRFCHKLNFTLENKTRLLCNDYLSKFNCNDICYERIKQVIKLAFNLNSFALFDEFINKNIYKLLCNKPRKIDGQKLFAQIEAYKNLIPDNNIWLVYLAAISSKEEALKLNLTTKELQIIELVDEFLNIKHPLSTNFSIYNFFKNKPIEAIIACCAFEDGISAQKYLNELKEIKPITTGKDLLSLGFPSGKIIGEVIEKILIEKLNGNLKTSKEEIEFARQFLDNF